MITKQEICDKLINICNFYIFDLMNREMGDEDFKQTLSSLTNSLDRFVYDNFLNSDNFASKNDTERLFNYFKDMKEKSFDGFDGDTLPSCIISLISSKFINYFICNLIFLYPNQIKDADEKPFFELVIDTKTGKVFCFDVSIKQIGKIISYRKNKNKHDKESIINLKKSFYNFVSDKKINLSMDDIHEKEVRKILFKIIVKDHLPDQVHYFEGLVKN